MAKTLEEKLFPADIAWVILNNLDKFNEKPNLIKALQEKFNYLTDHTIFGKFTDLFNEAVKYYDKHGIFPDIIFLNKKLPDGKLIKVLKNEEFSMSLYDDLVKTLDYEALIKKFHYSLAANEDVNINGCLELSKELANFANKNLETMSKDTKDSWLNSYDKYTETCCGMQTYMQTLDEAIGVLGNGALSTFAAPSGHGKSTFAISLAYNVSVFGGKIVDYISFEVPKNHIQFNLAAIESTYADNPNEKLNSSDIKTGKLDERGRELYQKHIASLMKKWNDSKGGIYISDQTEASCSTFEEFCAKLESIAEERGAGREADLIIIDNVDNLQVMQSSERDEATRVNQYIIALDKYCKTYCKNKGTHILLLSQVNRTGLKKLMCMENENKDEVTIDMTCIQKFNALYEKPTTVLVGYSTPSMRVNNMMKIMPIKLRNHCLPTKPVNMTVEFEYSKVGGSVYNMGPTSNEEIMAGLPYSTTEEEMEDINIDDIEIDEKTTPNVETTEDEEK